MKSRFEMRFEKIYEHISKEIAETLDEDLQSVVEWGQKWLVTFNAAKTKLVSFNKYKKPSLPPIEMAKSALPESTSFKLLGLTFTENMNWNKYIESIVKAAAKKVGSLYRARKLLSPESILYLYKATIRPCMEYCCHIWAGASATCLFLLDRVQTRVANLIGPELPSRLQPLPHRRNVASLCLFYKYFNGECSEELQALVPPRRRHPRQTRQAVRSHPYTVEIPRSKKTFYSNSFFARTVRLWNSLPVSCFPHPTDMQKFKCNVNNHLAYHLHS